MVSHTQKIKKRQQNKTATTNPDNKGQLFEENRSNDFDNYNETFRYITRNDDPVKARFALMSKYLDTYIKNFESYTISTPFANKIVKAIALVEHIVKDKLKFTMKPSEIHQILLMISRYMLFNELELVYFLAAFENLKTDKELLDAVTEVVDSLAYGFVFQREDLKMNSREFHHVLLLGFFAAISTKISMNPEDADMYMYAVEHNLSIAAHNLFNTFATKKPGVMEFSLILVNDVHKKLELDKIETKEIMDPAELFGELPMKKANLMHMDEDPLNLFWDHPITGNS